MPAAARKRAPEDEPSSKLIRIPAETYDLIQKWAEKERRYMNQQVAVIVEEWDAAQKSRGRK